MSSPAIAFETPRDGVVVPGRAHPGLTVTCERSFAGAAQAWRNLEMRVAGSPYGRLAWAEAWHATVGRAAAVEPCIVVGRNRDGVAALLPLGLRRRGPWRIAEFLGGKDSNANLGLFADPAAWTADDVEALLAAAARDAPIDLFALRNQPVDPTAGANPLLLLPSQPSPSDSLSGALLPGPDATLNARLSKHARKKLRANGARLGAERLLEHRVAATPDAIDAAVAAYLRLRSDRALDTGTTPPSAALADFLRLGAQAGLGSGPAIELHALHWGDEIIAVLGGATHRGRFSGMVTAFESRREVARNSPGELLIAAAVADLAHRGFVRFDLGIGEARYKATFCDTPEPMFDSFVGVTGRGRALASALSLAARLKRRIKRSPTVWPTAVRLRSAVSRVSRW